MQSIGNTVPMGTLQADVLRASTIPDYVGGIPLTEWPTAERLRDVLAHGFAKKGLPSEVNDWRVRNFPNLARGFRPMVASKVLNAPTFYGALFIDVERPNGEHLAYGLASLRAVTTAAVTNLCALFSGIGTTAPLPNFKYHGMGTTSGGVGTDVAGDTVLSAECTTTLNPATTRATGTPTNPSVNVYRSAGTLTVNASVAVVEHGVFSTVTAGGAAGPAAAGGLLLDRSTFAALNLANGDSIQFTYDFTATAGG